MPTTFRTEPSALGRANALDCFLQLLAEQPRLDLSFGGNVKQVKEKQGKEKEKQGKEKDKQGKDGKDTDGKKDHNHLRAKQGPPENIGQGALSPPSVRSADYTVSSEKRLFLVIYRDLLDESPDSPSDELMSQHLDYLGVLRESGQLDSAAAFTSGDGGLKILIAETEDEAMQLAAADPLIVSGYYGGFDVQELLPP
jgi:uncharacterized protein YciI